MKIRMLVARKGVPDKEGVIWDDEKLVEQLEDFAERDGIVTVNFDPERPVGRLTRVDSSDDGVYVEMEMDDLLAESLDFGSQDGPDYALTRRWSVAAPGVVGDLRDSCFAIKAVSAVPWEQSLWDPPEPT